MKHILIVDDEKLIRYSLVTALKNRETEVIALNDGKTALKAIRDWFFDFCFLDIGLPDMTGIDLMKTTKTVSPRTKIIMMTGSSVDEAGMSAIRDNAWLFLMKPFDLGRIKRLVEMFSLRDENVFQELEALERSLEERRSRQRRDAAQPVTYVTAKSQNRYYRGDLVDISETGTRIRTPMRLEPGTSVMFRNSVNNAEGIVRWSATDEESELYVAGIQFVGRQKRG